MKKLFGDSAFDDIYKTSARRLAEYKLSREGSSNRQLLDAGLNETIGSVALESYQNFQPEYKMQSDIRRYFGKEGVNYNTIASHPDFKHLNQSDAYIKQYICTMFIDIKGSTTLSLKYDLEFVHQFKNAVIQACIECIRAFDGYVHRIMGDAVLGFFGSKAISKEQAILDCMNCASILNVFLVQNIQPWLSQIKPDFKNDTDFGFRIGCNFGDDDEVLWANYGFGTTGEISPTGFSVDIAAKLQGLSRKNKAMMGQGLLEFINWPEKFADIKISKKYGNAIENPYVTPNYTKNSVPINYMMRELSQDNYLRGLPIPTDIKASLTSGITYCSQIRLENTLNNVDGTSQPFISNSTVALIGSSIDFKVKILNDNTLGFPLKVKFKKINHKGFGNNHPEALATLEKNDSPEFPVYYHMSGRRQTHFHEVSISRDCKYKGIHAMICEVRNDESIVIFREIIHVPIA